MTQDKTANIYGPPLRPSDENIKREWIFALRIYRRNRLGTKIAEAIVDRLEVLGVTDEDVDRVMAK